MFPVGTPLGFAVFASILIVNVHVIALWCMIRAYRKYEVKKKALKIKIFYILVCILAQYALNVLLSFATNVPMLPMLRF